MKKHPNAKQPPAATPSRKETSQPSYSAQEKCRAVLAIRAERRRPSEVCSELGVTYTQLSWWQRRAMEGILQALEPKSRLAGQARRSALSPQLQSLLERQSRRQAARQSRLEQRLMRLQQPEKPSS